MSWWVSLENSDGVVTVERHTEGGAHVKGGATAASLNVTYNYDSLHSEAGCHLLDLDGQLARDVIHRLGLAVQYLGIERDTDYWKATEGNAGYALSILLQWARQYPDAIFRVS